jgi:subtilase family serine protease
MRTHRPRYRPSLEPLDDRCLLSGLTPAQLTHAYGLDAITFTSSSGTSVKGDGTGETIALVDAYHDPNLSRDLHLFDQAYNLPDPALKVVNLAGKKTKAGWALEVALDVEWAHAIAPGARILVVEARSQNRNDLLAAVDRARRTPGVVAVSMSWGFNETSSESSSHFTTPPGHARITFIAASGDGGAFAGPEWPAVSPNVLSVGGTALTLDSTGNYQFETPWPGASGGYSQFVAEPSYQQSAQASGKRLSPDVAFDGDPQTGVEVYETAPHSRHGSWQVVGGTSLGAPAWAGIIAIVDQGRALANLPSLDGATQTLPALYSLPSSDFHTVESSVFDMRRGFPASVASTGLGSPVGSALIAALVRA